MPEYNLKLQENSLLSCVLSRYENVCGAHGNSKGFGLLRAIAQPLFPERTMTGLFIKDGLNNAFTTDKKLVLSVSENRVGGLSVYADNGMPQHSSEAGGRLHVFGQLRFIERSLTHQALVDTDQAILPAQRDPLSSFCACGSTDVQF